MSCIQKILDDAVRELKENEYSSIFESEKRVMERPETKVEFDESAYLENHYITDSVERLNLYRKLSEASGLEKINEWKEELEDRFGEIGVRYELNKGCYNKMAFLKPLFRKGHCSSK